MNQFSIVSKILNESQTPDSKVTVNLFGLADKKHFTEKDVNSEQLKLAIMIEMEHTTDPEISKKIALDHLAEEGLEKYYSNLINMEKAIKEKRTSIELIF